ncbi:hypothetical protein MtrunA17_Chr1g0159281 [Medicago truncatula]|uniref:Transmembrane protein n=1 Tax=Medicago truncatula TaxID=3880 RepID=A0A396JNK4_MEDTR|nr:hypothetical protein MtrunA17_Chr1g0159281 [Medicago truncatula]
MLGEHCKKHAIFYYVSSAWDAQPHARRMRHRVKVLYKFPNVGVHKVVHGAHGPYALFLLFSILHFLFILDMIFSLLETLIFPADLHAEDSPQEYLRILLRITLVIPSFLRIRIPQEHPRVTFILLGNYLRNVFTNIHGREFLPL